jgi:hypothetical protein
MRRSTPLRRALAVTASAGLAAGLAWLPASPAAAAVQSQMEAEVGADAGTDCPLTSGTDSDSSTSGVFNSGKHSRSASFDGTFTNTGDPTDTVEASGHYKGTVSIHKRGGDLGKLQLEGSGAVLLDVAKGNNTGCDPQAVVEAATIAEFTEHKAGWLYLKRTTPAKQGLAITQVVNEASNEAVQFEVFQGGKSQATSRGFSKPGTFFAQLVVGLTAGDTGIFLKAGARSSLSLVFYKAGSALTGTKGAGKSYVEFPGSISCGSHKATLRWKPSASKVAAGAFFVNGKKKASDSTPQGGEKVVLKHLSPKSDAKITAKLQLKGGGSATATRTYVPCKG